MATSLDHRIEGDATALFMLDAEIDNRPLYFERALAHDDQDVKIRVAAVISPHARTKRLHGDDQMRERVP